MINIGAVLVAAVSSFLLGGLWYSALFARQWERENGGNPQPGHPARVFGISFLFSLVAAFAFAWLLGPAPELTHAICTGALVGGGMVAASFGINYQFAQRSFTLWAIDGGYHLLQFVLFGVVLGLWH